MSAAEPVPERRPRPLVHGLGVAGWRVLGWFREQYYVFRMWRARGDVDSEWWVPRFGDRVQLHGEGTWLVFGVSIRRREVTLNKPGVQPFECISPADPADIARTHGWTLPAAPEPIEYDDDPVILDDPNVFTVDGGFTDNRVDIEGDPHASQDG